MPTWPTTNNFPQKLLRESLRESFANNVVRTPMDIGPPKVRRVTTANPRPISGKQLLTFTQAADLATFYNTTLANGSLSFTWVEPRSGTSCTMRFVSPPVLYSAGGVKVWVDYELEILP